MSLTGLSASADCGHTERGTLEFKEGPDPIPSGEVAEACCDAGGGPTVSWCPGDHCRALGPPVLAVYSVRGSVPGTLARQLPEVHVVRGQRLHQVDLAAGSERRGEVQSTL